METNIGEWRRVYFPESFYDDMDGKIVDETDKTYKLYFSKGIGEAIFYKDQVKPMSEI